MKRLLVPAFVAVVVLCAGCDTVRTLSGRPTAAQLEAKKQRILDSLATARAEAEKAEQRAQEQAAVADTLPVFEKFREMQVALNGRARFVDRALDRRYFIITGAYLDPDNAARSCKRYTDAGFPARILPFRNGFNAVAVAPSDRIADTYAAYIELRRNDFCPASAWILINE